MTETTDMVGTERVFFGGYRENGPEARIMPEERRFSVGLAKIVVPDGSDRQRIRPVVVGPKPFAF